MSTRAQLGIRHRQVRESILKLSVQEYAKITDVRLPTIYSWESGRTAVPQNVLALLESRYGISSGWLLTGTGSPLAQTRQQLNAGGEAKRSIMQQLEDHVSQIRELIEELKLHAPQVVAPARRKKSDRGPRIPMLAIGVSAGLPTASDDTIEREIDLADMLLENPESTYFIRVVGDSMTDAGISDGDTLIVDAPCNRVPDRSSLRRYMANSPSNATSRWRDVPCCGPRTAVTRTLPSLPTWTSASSAWCVTASSSSKKSAESQQIG